MSRLPLSDAQIEALAVRLDVMIHDAKVLLDQAEREFIEIDEARTLEKSMLKIFDMLSPELRVAKAKLERAKYEKAVGR